MHISPTLAFMRQSSVLPSLPLRIAEVNGRIMSNFNTMVYSNDSLLLRMPFVMGQDMSDILLSFMNWYLWTNAEVNTGNGFTIQSCAIESTAGTVVPVTFGGMRSKLINDGDNDIHSDPIPPSAFGKSKFARGEHYWVKAIIFVGNTYKIPRSTKLVNSVAGSQMGWYQASATFPSSTDSAGQYTVTGIALNNQPNGYHPIVLGHPIVDAPSFLAVGDSIGDGAGDTTAANLYGHGFIQRAVGNGGVSPLPCLNFCRATTTSDVAVAGSKWRSYIKYARHAIDEYGTNDFVVSNKSVATTQSSLGSLWTILKTGGIQSIIKSKLMCYTNSTDSWATSSGQTARTGWVSGDKSDQLNSWLDTKVADGTLGAAVALSGVKDTSTPTKWKTDGVTPYYMTGDGLHPSVLGHEAAAQALRPVLTALT